MTTINKSTFETISHMNSKLDNITEKPNEIKSNERPKTIHEIRNENRPAVSSALSRLGRPPIGIQLGSRRLTEVPRSDVIPSESTQRPAGRRITQTPRSDGIPSGSTWAPASTPILDRFQENGQRIKEILNLIERDINYGQNISYRLADTATKDLREELATRMKNIINSQAERTGGPLTIISESDLNEWFNNLMSEMGGFMNSALFHYRLVYGRNLNYDQYGPRETYVGSNQYFDAMSYGLASHRIDKVFTPQIRLYGVSSTQPTQPTQPTQGEDTSTAVIPPSGDPIIPPGAGEERERGTPLPRLTDDEFLKKYTTDPEILSEPELRSLEGKTIVFTQVRNEQNFSGTISGSGLFDNIYIYQQQPQGSLPFAVGSRSLNILRYVLTTGDYLNPLNLLFGTPVPGFVWLGPESKNNDFATGIADLVSFYHDCLYAGQSSGAGNNSRASDLISMKIARVCQYYLDARNDSRVPIMILKSEVNNRDLFITNQSSSVNDSSWLGRFIQAFQLIYKTIGAEETIQEIKFTPNDILNDEFMTRQQKLRIMWIYSEAINNNIFSFDTIIPDPNFSTFLMSASTINNELKDTNILDDTSWAVIRDSLNIASRKIAQWRNEKSTPGPNTDQNLMVRIQYFGVIRELMEIAADCIQTYYLNQELKPPTVWSIVPSERFDKKTDPTPKNLDMSDNLEDSMVPAILNMSDNSKLLFILRHLVIEGAVAY